MDEGDGSAAGRGRVPWFDVAATPLHVRLAPTLAGGLLRAIAAGRRAHVDSAVGRCCLDLGAGDLAVHLHLAADDVRGDDLATVGLAPIDGVPLAADRVLLPLLAAGDPVLVACGPRSAPHLAIRLDRPAAWLEVLGEAGGRGTGA